MTKTAVPSDDENFDVERAVKEYRAGYLREFSRGSGVINLPAMAVSMAQAPLTRTVSAMRALVNE